jgi:hypothetical protein
MITYIDCQICKWGDYTLQPKKCKAFPEGIPASILNGSKSHRKNINGDHGIHFEIPDIEDDEKNIHRHSRSITSGKSDVVKHIK